MPYKSTRHCAVPGCPGYAENGPYCAEHRRESNKVIRDPAVKKRYGYRWEKLRAAYLAQHPLCEECQRAGRLTTATEVHHVVPVVQGGSDDEGNLMALCKKCHSRETAREVWGR